MSAAITRKVLELLGSNAKHTRFFAKRVPVSAFLSGVPLGQGKCQAVILGRNQRVLNTTTFAFLPIQNQLSYSGDERGQFVEVDPSSARRPQASVLWCRDLSEIYVRPVSNVSDVVVQVMVYLSDDDLREWNDNAKRKTESHA